MAIPLSEAVLARPAIGIRALTYGGFALLVAIILATSLISVLALRDLARGFAELQRLHAAGELAAEIDRRMTALRLAARDVIAEGATDAARPLSQAEELAALLATARPQLSFEDRDMIDGIAQRLSTYRNGFERLLQLAQARTAGLDSSEASAEMKRLDDEVLRSEGRLIARTTELLRQSGARTERNLATQLTTLLDAATNRSLGLGAACVVIGGLCAFYVARRTVGPLSRITETMVRLAAGALRTEVPHLADRTEIGAMARATDIFKRAMIEIDAARLALAESRHWLHQVIDTVPAIVTVKDRDLRFVMVNRYAARVFGTDPEEAAGKTTNELMSRYGAAKSDGFDREVLETGQELGFYEDEYLDAEGELRQLLTKKVPLLDESGVVSHIVTVALDIGERKLAEAALRESEERYALAMEAVNEGVYDWNIETGEIFYSPRTLAVLDLTPDNLPTPHDWRQRVHPDDGQRYRDATSAHFRGETPRFECEYRFSSGHGSWRWARQHGIALRDADGRARRMAGSIGDITEIKEREQELAEANRHRDLLLADLNAVIDAIDYGVLFMGPDLRGRIINRAFRQMWGIPDAFVAAAPTMAELINYNRHNGLYDVPEAEFDAFVARRVKAIRAGNVSPVEMHRADGRTIRYEGIVLPDGGRMMTYLDITNSKRREAELREALEHQTATSEVLKAISRSAIDLEAVLTTVVKTAASLCRADKAIIYRYEGGAYRFAVGNDLSLDYERTERETLIPPGEGTLVGRTALAGVTVQIPDAWNDPLYADKEQARLGGVRSMLGVPLIRDGVPIGVIALGRSTVEPYTDKQVELVTTFADQAVIAIETARLFTETREALEQQTAAAELLGVINSSPGDLAPVFDAMLEKATRLCDAPCAILWIADGETFRAATSFGVPDAFAEFLRRPLAMMPSGALSGIRRGAAFVQNEDLAATDAYRSGNPLSRAVVDLGGGRTGLLVPLLKDGAVLGAIRIYRAEVRLFTEKQIALLQNFAAQAVIAMENARLLDELRGRTRDLQESLEYQTATSDALRVISQSGAELRSVLDTLVETAARICAGSNAFLYRLTGGSLELAAAFGITPEHEQLIVNNPPPISRGTLAGRTVLERQVVQIEDAAADPEYTYRESRQRGQFRTQLGVPLMREGDLVGVLAFARSHIEPFTEKQIALIATFADQAVIAMENARLLDEIRQRQAELRVTFDNMGDGVAMFDAELRLAAWNRNFQELLELPEEFLAEPRSYEGYLRYLARRGEFGAIDIEVALHRYNENVARQSAFERIRPDGRVVEVRHNPVPGGGFVLMYSDITERKRAEEEIRASRDSAEAALRDLKAAQANLIQAEKMASLGQLTAGIAHEIKNPLNFVYNFAVLSVDLLADLKETAAPGIARLDEDVRAEVDEIVATLTGNLAKIAEHGRRADGIVKSMLEHSRGASGERRDVDLNALVEEALNLAYHGARAQVQSFNITLERDYAPTLGPIEVAPQEMTRVFLNLFGNGFYATNKRVREGGDRQFRPTLTVATRELGDTVEVRVRDNGTGIPPDIKDKLFQPFFTTKPTGEGTGLGLSISYEIVSQQHGGTIAVDSQVGEFTEFTIRLPRDRLRANSEATT